MGIDANDLNLMQIACQNASKSNDPKCKVGCVVSYQQIITQEDSGFNCECECYYYQKYHVDKEPQYITKNSTYRGYNKIDFPHGLSDKLCGMILNNAELKNEITVHAEQHILGFKGNHKKFDDYQKAVLYTTKFPCLDCAEIIVESNIKRIVTAYEYQNSKWYESQREAKILFNNSGVTVDYIDIEMVYSFPKIKEFL
jgi:deoxycytidylate deaminase